MISDGPVVLRNYLRNTRTMQKNHSEVGSPLKTVGKCSDREKYSAIFPEIHHEGNQTFCFSFS